MKNTFRTLSKIVANILATNNSCEYNPFITNGGYLNLKPASTKGTSYLASKALNVISAINKAGTYGDPRKLTYAEKSLVAQRYNVGAGQKDENGKLIRLVTPSKVTNTQIMAMRDKANSALTYAKNLEKQFALNKATLQKKAEQKAAAKTALSTADKMRDFGL